MNVNQALELINKNIKTLKEYYTLIDKDQLPVMRGIILNEEDILRRDVITELMCNFRLSKKKIETKYNINFDVHFKEALKELESLQDDGLIELESEKLSVTNAGRLLIRNIAMKFDEYLMKKEKDKPQFSRTV